MTARAPWIAAAAALAALAGAPVARAEPARPTAVARADAPREGGLERALMFLPRLVARAFAAPIRLGQRLEARHDLSRRTRALFFDDTGTYGVYPVADWDGGLSAKLGAQAEHTDVLGLAVRARATVGITERTGLLATIDTGRLLGPVVLEVGGRYRDIRSTRFFGYGDADERAIAPAMPVDPVTTDVAFATELALEERMAHAAARVRLGGGVEASLAGSLRRLGFAEAAVDPGEVPIGMVYDLSALPGFEDGVTAVRVEAAVRIDRRRGGRSRAAPASGWAAQLHAGWQHGIAGDPARFGYGGLDAIGHLDLHDGRHVLTLRGTLDAALGPRDAIPFTELPTLGGATALRGYPSGRFRDRWAATVSAEYGWPIVPGVAGLAFVDTGQVGAGAVDLVGGAPRVGFGAGLELHTSSSMLARFWLASSIDGGVTAVLQLQPSFGARAKERLR